MYIHMLLHTCLLTHSQKITVNGWSIRIDVNNKKDSKVFSKKNKYSAFPMGLSILFQFGLEYLSVTNNMTSNFTTWAV